MKKQTFRLFMVFCVTILLGSCTQSPEKSIVGEWKGTDHTGETASLVFYEDYSAKMMQDGMALDGSSMGVKITWRMDDGHDPMHLDLVLADPTGETHVLPMIVRFISDSKIQLRSSDDMTSRPIEFSDSDEENQIILTRQ
jgi:hypothetical protein